MSDKITQKNGPELVFALVGALGADLDGLAANLEYSLQSVGYNCYEIRLSALLPSNIVLLDAYSRLFNNIFICYNDLRVMFSLILTFVVVLLSSPSNIVLSNIDAMPMFVLELF